jgi:hypothetical protein
MQYPKNYSITAFARTILSKFDKPLKTIYILFDPNQVSKPDAYDQLKIDLNGLILITKSNETIKINFENLITKLNEEIDSKERSTRFRIRVKDSEKKKKKKKLKNQMIAIKADKESEFKSNKFYEWNYVQSTNNLIIE